MGKKCVNGVDFSAHEDTFVQGDYICQIFYKPAFAEKLDKLYKQIKEIKDMEMKKVLDLLSEPHEIEVLITKNSTMAEKLREEARGIYLKNKK